MSILITHDEISLNKYLVPLKQFYRLPWWLRQLSICLQCGRPGFDPWVGKIRWRMKWQSTPVLSPGKSHGQRSLVGYKSMVSQRVRHD